MDEQSQAKPAQKPKLPIITDPVHIDIQQIMKAIPHRYPFLLIDRLISLTPNQEAIGLKAVTATEPHFQGHFPQLPIMPGVMIVEAMAQTAAVMVVHSMGDAGLGKMVYFMTIDHTKFRKPVVPGDMLHLHIIKQKQHGPVWKFNGIGYVDGVKVAESQFSAMIRDAE